jgi:hypothetical protein
VYDAQVFDLETCPDEILGEGRGVERVPGDRAVIVFDEDGDGENFFVDVDTGDAFEDGVHTDLQRIPEETQEQVNKKSAAVETEFAIGRITTDKRRCLEALPDKLWIGMPLG